MEHDRVCPIGTSDHPAHDHRLLKQPGIPGTCHLAQHTPAAGGLPCDRNVVRISAKSLDVPDHPPNACLLVKTAEVGGRIRLLSRELRMRQESKDIEAVVDRDHHHSPAREPLSVKLHLRRISPLQRSSVDPHHDRLTLRGRLRPRVDIQIQAVFVHGDVRIHMPLPAVDIIPKPRRVLHRDRTEPECIADAFPVLTGLRRPPSVPADRRCRKRDSLKCRDPRVRPLHSANPAIFCFCCSYHLFSFPPVPRMTPAV